MGQTVLAPVLYDANGKTVDPGPPPKEDEIDDELEDYGKGPRNPLYLELPVYGVPPPDRTWVVEGILQQLEVGNFHDAAWLWDSMKRDARIRSTMGTRVRGLLGSGIECSALKDSQASRHGNSKSGRQLLVAEELRHSWPQMHNSATLARGIDYALGLGVCVLEKIYVQGSKRRDYRLKVWHPQFVQWRWDTRRYWLTTQNLGQVPLPRPEETSSQWIVLCPYGFEYAYLEGLVRSLAAPWLGRNWDQQDWARYNEIHGRAIRLAYVPENAKDAHKKAFFSQVARLNAEAAIRLPRDKDGVGYDLKLLEAVANTWKTFAEKVAWADRTIATLGLGQHTSTDGASGLGSDEAPGDSVRIDIKKGDNTWLSQDLYQQGIREWVEFNWGDADLAPAPPQDDRRSGYWQVEPADDMGGRAKGLLDFGRGFAALKNATKAIDVRALLDSYGYPILSEADQAAAEEEAEAKQAAIADPPPSDPPAEDGKEKARAADRPRAELVLLETDYLRAEALAATSEADCKNRLRALYRSLSAAELTKIATAAWQLRGA